MHRHLPSTSIQQAHAPRRETPTASLRAPRLIRRCHKQRGPRHTMHMSCRSARPAEGCCGMGARGPAPLMRVGLGTQTSNCYLFTTGATCTCAGLTRWRSFCAIGSGRRIGELLRPLTIAVPSHIQQQTEEPDPRCRAQVFNGMAAPSGTCACTCACTMHAPSPRCGRCHRYPYACCHPASQACRCENRGEPENPRVWPAHRDSEGQRGACISLTRMSGPSSGIQPH